MIMPGLSLAYGLKTARRITSANAPKTFSFDAAKARNAFRQASDLQ
jgi:hypothetical protein